MVTFSHSMHFSFYTSENILVDKWRSATWFKLVFLQTKKKSANKKVLLRERKRHTARKRAQDADSPPAGWTDPPLPAGLTHPPPPADWTDLTHPHWLDWPTPPGWTDLTPPSWTDLTPPPPAGLTHPPQLDWPDPPPPSWTDLTPHPAGLTWPSPPQVWTDWKHYLPPSFGCGR